MRGEKREKMERKMSGGIKLKRRKEDDTVEKKRDEGNERKG